MWRDASGRFRAFLRQLGADLRHLLLAAVPAERLFRLRTLDPDRFQWVAVNGWPEAVEVIRAKPIDMAVVDPLLTGGTPRPHGIERLRLFFPSLPLLVYTDLTPANAAVLLQLGRAGIRRVIVHRFEDAPSALRAALLSELEQSASQQVMQALEPTFRDLPPELQDALEAMLHAPGDGPTVTTLAERARLTRRTCERWFTKVGLPSPRTVMVLIRLLYAHRLLLDPGYTVEDVALKLGYSKTKTLQMHLRAVFGLTAGELRVSLSTEDALAAVTHRYFTPLRQVAS
jgi:AraC-like DNA-binding protein